MHEKHRGHDAMHAEMMLILIVTLFVAQIILVQWRQRHFRSYQVTILCLSVSSVSLSRQYFSSGLYYFGFTNSRLLIKYYLLRCVGCHAARHVDHSSYCVHKV